LRRSRGSSAAAGKKIEKTAAGLDDAHPGQLLSPFVIELLLARNAKAYPKDIRSRRSNLGCNQQHDWRERDQRK
jgi:hypothetical protein